jgi:hypothetical protein
MSRRRRFEECDRFTAKPAKLATGGRRVRVDGRTSMGEGTVKRHDGNKGSASALKMTARQTYSVTTPIFRAAC